MPCRQLRNTATLKKDHLYFEVVFSIVAVLFRKQRLLPAYAVSRVVIWILREGGDALKASSTRRKAFEFDFGSGTTVDREMQ